MSDTSEAASRVKRQRSSDTESHNIATSIGSYERSSSSEPLIESSKRAKRSHPTVSDAESPTEPGQAKRAKVSIGQPWWILYAEELNNTIRSFTTLKPMRKPFKGTLHIGASQWTPEERHTLYQALARVGRDETRILSDLIETKSALEIEVFLRILQRGSDETAIYDPNQCVHMIDIPAASEINEDLERGLEQAADVAAQYQDEQEREDLFYRHGELWLLDRSAVDIVDAAGFEISNFISMSDPIARDSAAALELFNLTGFLDLSRNVFMNSQDPQQNYTTFAAEDEEPSLRLTAAVDLFRIVKTLTAQLFLTAHHCALTRIRDKGEEQDSELLENDVRAALEILRQSDRHLRVHGTEYRIGMLRRHDVQPVVDVGPNERPRHISIDGAEWWLRRRLHPPEEAQRANDLALNKADLERACAEDMQAENQIERLKLRNMEELFNDHEPFTTNVASTSAVSESKIDFEKQSGEESELDVSFKEDAEAAIEEEYVDKLDAIADANEAKRLWELCKDNTPGEVYNERTLSADIPKPPRRLYRTVRRNWRDALDYKPEWEQYREPIALQMLERTLPKDATSPDSAPEANAREASLLASRRVSDGMEENNIGSATHPAPKETVTEALEEDDDDTNMEDESHVESSATTSSGSSSTVSSSEVSSSSED